MGCPFFLVAGGGAGMREIPKMECLAKRLGEHLIKYDVDHVNLGWDVSTSTVYC